MDTNNNNNQRYVIVQSNRFQGYYDILDTQTGQRRPSSTQSVRWLRYEVQDLNKQQESIMNEFRNLTYLELSLLHLRAKTAIKNMSQLMHPSDRAYLRQRETKLRQELDKRVGQ